MFLDDIFHGNSHHARQETARHRDADQDSKFSILAGLDNRRHHNRKRQPRQTPPQVPAGSHMADSPRNRLSSRRCIHKQNRKPDQLRAICSKQRGKHCLCLADWNDGCTLSEIPPCSEDSDSAPSFQGYRHTDTPSQSMCNTQSSYSLGSCGMHRPGSTLCLATCSITSL